MRIFFFKKGQNSRMGKGTGSFHTTRRLLKSGTMLFSTGGRNRTVLTYFYNYVRARIGNKIKKSIYKGCRRVFGRERIHRFMGPFRLFSRRSSKRRSPVNRIRKFALILANIDVAFLTPYNLMWRCRTPRTEFIEYALTGFTTVGYFTTQLLGGLRRNKTPFKKKKFHR